ncbi:MAG: hypothetical protein M3273_02290 [Actinomycetota bacterium]|nr:hypothetical protein [Actinomycetota bacterium]
MRKILIGIFTAALVGAPLAASASADPVIQPIRCMIGDRTGIYVGGKCSGPY